MYLLRLLPTAAVMTATIGWVTGPGWVGYAIGAVLAVTLWLIMFCSTLAGPKDRSLAERVPART